MTSQRESLASGTDSRNKGKRLGGFLILTSLGLAALMAISGTSVATESAAMPAPATYSIGASTLAHPNLTSVRKNSFEIGQVAGSSLAIALGSNGGYSITPGQTWDGVNVGRGYGTITVNASNRLSTTPAAFFAQNAYVAMNSSNQSNALPKELNWAFTGTLTINGTSYPVVIGLGGHDTYYVGGHDLLIDGGGPELVTNDSLYMLNFTQGATGGSRLPELSIQPTGF